MVPVVPLAWVVFGAAVAVGAWRMDRLEQMHINPYSAPGLVPGVLGVLIVVFGLAMAWRERRSAGVGKRSGPAADAVPDPTAGQDDLRHPVAIAAALCVVFAAGMLGRGWPFALTSGLFVFAFIAVFSRRRWARGGGAARGLTGAAVIATVASILIALLFTEVFLVRLP